ncbi:MAG: hypothetical protein ACHQ4J_06085 [Candidatus Binatia bacterium]
MLKQLLGHPDLDSAEHERLARLALARLQTVFDGDDASYLLRWCLSDRQFPNGETPRLLRLAVAWMEARPDDDSLDYVFNRILRRRDLPDEEWKRVAAFALRWLKRTAQNKDRDHTLNSLLVRPNLLEPQELDLVISDAIRWLEDQSPSTFVATALVSNLQRASAGTPREQDVADVADFYHVASRSLAQTLTQLACQTAAIPDSTLLQQGVEAADQQFRRAHPASAGYYVSALLPLVHRLGDYHLQESVMDLATRILGHDDLMPTQRAGFASACFRLLDLGAWPDASAGERILDSLGLVRSTQHTRGGPTWHGLGRLTDE